ncbi:MAG: hypothetical protein HY897_11035, partial [Deltaproteobacteria bacterium]|nr:hypothetical protein [Deltaproteobacteria bacterium]
MNTKTWPLCAALTATIAFACAEIKDMGGEGQECFTEGQCNEGFMCNAAGICRRPSEDGLNGDKRDGGGGKSDGGADAGICANELETCSSIRCCPGFECNEQDKCTKGACTAVGNECEWDEDCCQGSDTTKGAWCNEEGKCTACSNKTGACTSDYDCCPPTGEGSPLMCTSKGACAPICEKDSDCAAGVCSGKDEVCMPNGECVCPSCSTDDECNGKKCCSGD